MKRKPWHTKWQNRMPVALAKTIWLDRAKYKTAEIAIAKINRHPAFRDTWSARNARKWMGGRRKKKTAPKKVGVAHLPRLNKLFPVWNHRKVVKKKRP